MSFFRPSSDLFLLGPVAKLPERVMTNDDLVRFMEASFRPSWIARRCGVEKRHWANDDEACSDLAVAAATEFFEQKPHTFDEVRQLIVASISGDFLTPPTSPLVQHRLGLKNIGVFDLGAACAGFVAGLHAASALTLAQQESTLLVCAEIRSKFLNKRDFATAVLFGDGAAACSVSTSQQGADFRILASQLFADGSLGDVIAIASGGSKNPAHLCQNRDDLFLHMKDGAALFLKAVEGMSECAMHFLKRLSMSVSEVDWFVPHQANAHLIGAVADRVGIAREKVVQTIEYTGNTSGASTAIALAALLRRDCVETGQKIMVVAGGAGGIGAAALLEKT